MKKVDVKKLMANSPNPLHVSHLYNGIKGGVFGGGKREKRKRERKNARLELKKKFRQEEW